MIEAGMIGWEARMGKARERHGSMGSGFLGPV